MGGASGDRAVSSRPACTARDASLTGGTPSGEARSLCVVGARPQLVLAAEPVGDQLPAVPVVLGHPVLDADDRIALNPFRVQVDQLRSGERLSFPGEPVGAVAEELAGCGIERHGYVFARPVTRRL